MMRRASAVCLLILATAAECAAAAPGDWPLWRGPLQNGIADSDQDPPTAWGKTQNVVWKAAVPGGGHGSPVVVRDHVYLATADLEAQRQDVICYDRASGEQLWRTAVHEGGLEVKGNGKASLASSTVACNGTLLFANFLNGGAVYTTALSCADGKRLWQTKISDYVVHQGYGTSPTLYKDFVIVAADNKGGGALACLQQASGRIVWSNPRPKRPNYVSPRVVSLGGRDQLLMTGCDLVSSFDPLSGKTIWEFPGATTECVASTVTDGQRVFTSGGYPKNHVAAVLADGSGKLQWQNGARVYVPSMIVDDGHLYAVSDKGVAYCWKSDSGQELWKQRLPGSGAYFCSPIRVGKRIYVSNDRGLTNVFAATPESFEPIASNQLGDSVMASPAICGGRVYLRVIEEGGGKRQEVLYCLGQ